MLEQRRIGNEYRIDPEFKEMKREREIAKVKLEVLNSREFENIFMRKYKLQNGDSEYDFPTCKGCGNILSSSDLLKIFPERENVNNSKLSNHL